MGSGARYTQSVSRNVFTDDHLADGRRLRVAVLVRAEQQSQQDVAHRCAAEQPEAEDAGGGAQLGAPDGGAGGGLGQAHMRTATSTASRPKMRGQVSSSIDRRAGEVLIHSNSVSRPW
eukprot:1054702-Prymnesium_polylepis.1